MAIGTDFERFLRNGDGPVSAEFLGLPDKFAPHVELHDENGVAGHIHRDNMMIELCVAPQNTGDALQAAVSRVLQSAKSFLAERAPEVSISEWSEASFREEDLNTPAARELGCDVDFLALDMDSVGRGPLNAGMMERKRFAGGHLHFSWPRLDIPAWVGAGICDLLIGLPEARFLNEERAQFYGAGSLHRPTQYPDGTRGVEYRPLDCYWTTSEAHLARVAKRADAVHKVLNEGDVGFIRTLVDLWMPLGTPRGVLARIGQAPLCRDASQKAAETFRKEFGYDPV